MKIHHLSSAHFEGGAARAGYRLHRGLVRLGLESVWLDASKNTPCLPDIKRVAAPRRRWKGFARLFRLDERRRFRRVFSGTWTLATLPSGLGRAALISKPGWPDVFNFHWVSDYLDWNEALPAITSRAPVVWTLHDLNPIAGVWHYDPDPQERNGKRDSWDRRIQWRKRDLLERIPRERLVFVAPSAWMAGRARASEIAGGFEVHHIPNGIDTEVFYPGERSRIRAELGLPAEGKLVGFVADNLTDRRKGIAQLYAALGEIKGDVSVLLAVAGAGDMPQSDFRQYKLGAIREDARMRAFYAACDLFVCPSLQDNLPNTVMEAMACGTPVVGFEVGGIPDMIQHGETGALVPLGDVGALAAVIRALLADSKTLTRMGLRARAVVEERYAMPVIARRMANLYLRLSESQSIANKAL